MESINACNAYEQAYLLMYVLDMDYSTVYRKLCIINSVYTRYYAERSRMPRAALHKC